MISPSPTTTFLSRIARRTTAPLPMRTPGISTLPSTVAPSSIITLELSTELRTVAADRIDPAPTTDSCASPPFTNFAGARFSVAPRMGQRRL